MQHYEIVFLIHPEHTELMPGILNHLKDLITSSGGQLHRFEELGRRSLAYPIKKLTRAYYVLMNIEVDLPTLNALKERFKYQESILRELIIRMPEAVTQPSALLNSKEDRFSPSGSHSFPSTPTSLEPSNDDEAA